jgi:hypothetical protein
MLYNKEEETIMTFLPSSDSTYCDLCLIYSIRSQTFTIDIVPSSTCGFIDIDDNAIYLGTEYGAVLKYDETSYIDQIVAAITGTGEVDTDGVISGSSVSLDTDGSLLGAPIYAVDATNKMAWRNTIDGNTSSTITPASSSWIPVFNSTVTIPSGTTISFYIGHILAYDKSPLYAIGDGEEVYDKLLKEIEYIGNDFTNVDYALVKASMTSKGGTKTSVKVMSSTSPLAKVDVFNGRHNYFQAELCLLTDAELRIRSQAYYIEKTRGRLSG